jgi:hypothetical protein
MAVHAAGRTGLHLERLVVEAIAQLERAQVQHDEEEEQEAYQPAPFSGFPQQCFFPQQFGL